MILACDVHLHMRGYVVVSATPWFQVCSREGRFRLEDVPAGRYVLNVWHEMGEPLRKEIVVEGGKAIELPELVLAGPSVPDRVAGTSNVAPVRPWAEVVDRIGVLLAASRAAATRPGEMARARRLAEDAYWAEFEASDMEVAVRRHLGYARAGELEQQFRAVPLGGPRRGRTPAARVGPGRPESRPPAEPGRRRERAECEGCHGPAHIDANHRDGAAADLPSLAEGLDYAGSRHDPGVLLRPCVAASTSVGQKADQDGPMRPRPSDRLST